MGTFKCMWCGEHEITDKEGHKIVREETLDTCPYCNKKSYGNSMRISYKIDASKWKAWRMVFGRDVSKKEEK